MTILRMTPLPTPVVPPPVMPQQSTFSSNDDNDAEITTELLDANNRAAFEYFARELRSIVEEQRRQEEQAAAAAKAAVQEGRENRKGTGGGSSANKTAAGGGGGGGGERWSPYAMYGRKRRQSVQSTSLASASSSPAAGGSVITPRNSPPTGRKKKATSLQQQQQSKGGGGLKLLPFGTNNVAAASSEKRDNETAVVPAVVTPTSSSEEEEEDGGAGEEEEEGRRTDDGSERRSRSNSWRTSFLPGGGGRGEQEELGNGSNHGHGHDQQQQCSSSDGDGGIRDSSSTSQRQLHCGTPPPPLSAFGGITPVRSEEEEEEEIRRQRQQQHDVEAELLISSLLSEIQPSSDTTSSARRTSLPTSEEKDATPPATPLHSNRRDVVGGNNKDAIQQHRSASSSSSGGNKREAPPAAVGAALSKRNLIEITRYIKRTKRNVQSLKVERDGLIDIVHAVSSATGTSGDGMGSMTAMSYAADCCIDCGSGGVGVGGGSSSTTMEYHGNPDGTKPKTLPLHVVQMLETMPWDDRVREHIAYTEEVYEWQCHQPKIGWTTQLSKFSPSFLQTLASSSSSSSSGMHRERSGSIQDMDNSHHSNSSITTSSSRTASTAGTAPHLAGIGEVFTDKGGTKLLDMGDGFPLPEGGEWKWVGGWRVDPQDGLPCDGAGWTYAPDARDLANRNRSECHERPGEEEMEEGQEEGDERGGNGGGGRHRRGVDLLFTMRRPFRCRRWSRHRVLVSYPFIGDKARNFLALSAQNASLTVSITKLSNQLLDTQSRVVDLEEQVVEGEEVQRQAERLMDVVKEKEKKIQDLEDALLICHTKNNKSRDAPGGNSGGGGGPLTTKFSVRPSTVSHPPFRGFGGRRGAEDCDTVMSDTVSLSTTTTMSSSESMVVCTFPQGPPPITPSFADNGNGKDLFRLFGKLKRQMSGPRIKKSPSLGPASDTDTVPNVAEVSSSASDSSQADEDDEVNDLTVFDRDQPDPFSWSERRRGSEGGSQMLRFEHLDDYDEVTYEPYPRGGELEDNIGRCCSLLQDQFVESFVATNSPRRWGDDGTVTSPTPSSSSQKRKCVVITAATTVGNSDATMEMGGTGYEPTFEYFPPDQGSIEMCTQRRKVGTSGEAQKHQQSGDPEARGRGCYLVAAAASVSKERRQEIAIWMQMEPDVEC